MTRVDTERGQPFDGRYRVLGRLGVGGMATVYLAEDSSLGRKVALKVMAERYAEDGEFVERFRREAQAAARLNHPNIIAVYDRGEADGRPYIAMEYLQGRTLKQVIQAEGPLSPERAIAIAMQVLAGLRYAHEHGVVHRDVKPHNVLVGDDGRIKVTDFGIAHAGDPQMTEVGSIVGTAQYLSPEQARGRSVGPQTDIYSLGVVLYEMLAGRVPFEGDSSVAIAMQHVSDQPPPLRSLAPDVPESLALVVAHAMLKDPAQRYGSADEFAADLDRVRRGLVPVAATAAHTAIVTHEPTELVPAVEATRIAPRPEPTPLLSGEKLPPRPTPRKRSRWPWLLVLLLLLAVGALAAFAIGGVPGGGSPPTTATTGTATTQPPVASHKLDNLEGKTLSEALGVLHSYQLGLDIKKAQHVRDATHDADIVVGSNPDAGVVMHRGDSVRLKVSRGQKAIPNIVGQTQADAQQQLGSDFKFTLVPEASDFVDKGKVTRTDPVVGTKTPVGSPVNVYISTGPKSVQVPNLVGRSENDARTALDKAGLIVKEPPGSRCSDSVAVGQVAKQGTQTGQLVPQNTAISFDVASSPCTVDVPNVRTLPVDQAIGLLRAKTIAAGNIKIIHQTVSEQSQDGIVLDQDIEGTNTKPFVVHLTVGQLDQGATTATTSSP
ncbi:MAG: Stk1 family PASTA domain-containing Ser/Thr kinase [Actinomycetota bacterium]|nr:Stk1 family PASTA domain-containing Ser/Thr kinase [Actinomycetota bacterium]